MYSFFNIKDLSYQYSYKSIQIPIEHNKWAQYFLDNIM